MNDQQANVCEAGRRDCRCPRARHVHGTRLAYIRDGCRGRACTTANTEAERARLRAQLYGRYDGLVDAEPARKHVHALMAAGVGLKQITRLSGIGGGSLTKLVYGWPREDGARRPPAKRVKPATVDRILAIPLDGSACADGQCIDGTGTRRRLQALVALGWPQGMLARRLGMHPATFGETIRGDRVLAGTARAAAELFERMWSLKPAETGHREKISAGRARRQATVNGWVPPLAWDDDTIDDPSASPATGEPIDVDEVRVQQACAGRAVDLNRAERAEAIRWLHAHGLSTVQIAAQLGMKPSAVQKHRDRHMPDTIRRRRGRAA